MCRVAHFYFLICYTCFMLQALTGLKIFLKSKNSKIIFFVFSLIIFLGYFFLENWGSAIQVLSFDTFSLAKRVYIFLLTLFSIQELAEPNILFLVITVSIFSGLVMSLLYTYVKIREKVLLRHGVYSGFGMIFAVFGVGCAACGTILLQTILSFFGFGSLLAMFPYHGIEIGYLGLIFLIFNAYTLSYKLGEPLVC